MTGARRFAAALATAVLLLTAIRVPVAAAFATFETPSADATYGERVRAAGRSPDDPRQGRGSHRVPGRAGAGADRGPLAERGRPPDAPLHPPAGRRPHPAEHEAHGALAADAERRGPDGPGGQRPLLGHPIRLANTYRIARPDPLVRGRRCLRAAGARHRRQGRPAGRGPARSEGVGTDRLLRLRIAGAVLRRPGPRDPGERRWRGARRDSDDVRPDHARRDRCVVGRDRPAPRAHPPRLQHGCQEPLPLPAALAQRGHRRVPVRGIWQRQPDPNPGRSATGRDHAAGRADRSVPDDRRPLLSRLRRERIGGRLPREDLRP